jgi:DNA-binding GntR family transcriptional regulator
LDAAASAKIRTLDTARAYGDSETVIGNYSDSQFAIQTKFGSPPAIGSDWSKWLHHNLSSSEQCLGSHELRTVFLHDTKDLTKSDNSSVRQGLHKFSKSRATQVEAQALGLHGNQWVFRIENVLHLQGQPVIHDRIAIAAVMFPGLNQATFTARTTTIYGHYQAAFGVTIVEADERVRAELVLPDSARLLNLDLATPVLRIDRVAHTFDRKPAEFRTSFVDTRNFDYVSRMREMA